MQGQVHRFRLGSWHPRAIKAMAVSRAPTAGAQDVVQTPTYLAVGREDGEIELMSPGENFCTVGRIAGAEDFKLQALCWSQFHEEDVLDGGNFGQNQRLFGISLRGFIFEVSLSTLSLTNICDTYGGAAWCLAASPRANMLAVGGEDGAVRLFSYSGTKLHYLKSLPTSGSRVLCVAFHPTQPRLFLGCSDGTIRCLDEDTGRTLFRMMGDVHANVYTAHIWTLAVLSDGTVLAGDSKGQLQVFDGNVGVYTAGYITHSADILAVAVNETENMVFASGVDGKVVCMQRSAAASWTYAHSHRAHSHDVYALALSPNSLGQITGSHLLLSGGLDGKVCLYSSSAFNAQRPHWLPIIPSRSPAVTHSGDYGVIVVAARSSLEVWTTYAPALGDGEDVAKGSAQCAARIVFKTPDHIQHVAFLPVGPASGHALLVSTASALKLFRVLVDEKGAVTYERAQVLQLSGAGAQLHVTKRFVYVFDPATRDVSQYSLTDREAGLELQLAQRLHTDELDDDVTQASGSSLTARLSRAVSSLRVSSDDEYIFLGTAGAAVLVYSWVRRALHWAVATPHGRSFQDMAPFAHEGVTHGLMVLCGNNTLCAYDVQRLEVHPYMHAHREQVAQLLDPEAYRFPLTSVAALPAQAHSGAEAVTKKKKSRGAAEVVGGAKFLLYGPLYCIFVDLSTAPPQAIDTVLRHPVSSIYRAADRTGKDKKGTDKEKDRKRKKEKDVEVPASNFAVIELFRNIVHMGMLDNNQLVVVENPWARINAQLPDAVARKRYMT